MRYTPVLARWEKLHGVEVASLGRFLEGGEPAALEALRAPHRSCHESWLLEDLLEVAPDPWDAWDEATPRLVRALAVLEERGGSPPMETPLCLLARWLERRLRREPEGRDGFAAVGEGLALPAEKIVELAWRALPANGRLTSAARFLLVQPLAALEPILRVARHTREVPPLVSLVACHAPARLPEVARLVYPLYDPFGRSALLALLLASPEPAAIELAAELAGDDPPRDARAWLAARWPGRFALATSAREVVAELVRRKRLPEALGAIASYLDRGDPAELARIPRLPPSRSPFAVSELDGLLDALPQPGSLGEPEGRALDVLIQADAESVLGRWVDRAVAIERPGEDLLAAAREELARHGLESARASAFLSRLGRLRAAHGPTSIGRAALALEGDALAAYAREQLESRFSAGLVFLLEAVPERVLPLLASLPVQRYLVRALLQSPLLGSLLAAHPALFEPVLRASAEDPGSLFAEEERALAARRHEQDGVAFERWRLLASHDRERFLERACACARAIASDPRHPRRSEAIQWLVRTLGGDALEPALARIADAATEHDAFAVAYLLAGVFGPRARPALDWLLARQQPYYRQCALQILIAFRDPSLDPLIDEGIEGLLCGSDLQGQLRGIDLCERWGFARKAESIWRLLESKAKQLRARAARSLTAHAEPASYARALSLLAHKQAAARLGAVELLRALDLSRAAPELEARLEEEPSEEVRDELLLALTALWRAEGRTLGWEEIERRIARTRLRDELAPWLSLESLPPLQLVGSDTPLPRRAVHYLLHRQARVRGVRADLEAEALYALVDRRRSGDFALALLEACLDAGGAVEESWALTVAAILGDERVVPRLVVAVRDFIKDRRLGFAEYAVRALALQGSDAALLALDGIALRHAAKPKNVGEAASEAFAEAAERQDRTPDELRDRVVPWLGFEPGKPRLVACGEKTIEVTIGDDLRHAFRDARSGKPIRSLPKGAPAEVALALKEEKGILGEAMRAQCLRLENLMVVGHRWRGALYRERFLGHPLLQPFARRLVFGRYGAGGALEASFRARADGVLVDATGAEVALTDDAAVGMVHPLELEPEALDAWRAVVAAEGAPPFPQLERPVHRVSDEERELEACYGWVGASVGTGQIKRMTERLGWRRGDSSGGWIHDYYLAFPLAEVVARIALEEMPVVLELSATARLGLLRFSTRAASRRLLRLDEVPARVYSETLSSLEKLAGQPRSDRGTEPPG